MNQDHAPLVNDDDQVEVPRRVRNGEGRVEPLDGLVDPVEERGAEPLAGQVPLRIELLQNANQIINGH